MNYTLNTGDTLYTLTTNDDHARLQIVAPEKTTYVTLVADKEPKIVKSYRIVGNEVTAKEYGVFSRSKFGNIATDWTPAPEENIVKVEKGTLNPDKVTVINISAHNI